MKALSIRHPWAWAVTHAGKRVENRDWHGGRAAYWRGLQLVGPVAIHASKLHPGVTAALAAAVDGQIPHRVPVRALRDEASDVDDRLTRSGFQCVADLTLGELQRTAGAIVGVARIVATIDEGVVHGAHPHNAKQSAERPLTPAEGAWYTGGFAVLLDDVRAIEPVPASGALGFWTVPGEVEAKVHAAPPCACKGCLAARDFARLEAWKARHEAG